MRVTRKNICEAIKKETGLWVELYKVKDDYFYFWSKDPEIDLYLSGLPSTSVYTNRLGDSISSWVEEFKGIISGKS